MSLTDKPKQLAITDIYPEGTPFMIEQAWFEGVVDTQYGKRSLAKAVVAASPGGPAQEFALWGSLCEQVQAIEEGDVPGAYKIVKDGKRWLFADASAEMAGFGEEAATT